MSRAYCFPLVLPNLQLSQSSGHSILKWSLSWSLLQFTVFTIAQGCWWSPPNLESYPPPLNIVTSQQEERFFFCQCQFDFSMACVCDWFSNGILPSSSCRKPISMASLYCSVRLWVTLHPAMDILVGGIWLLGWA